MLSLLLLHLLLYNWKFWCCILEAGALNRAIFSRKAESADTQPKKQSVASRFWEYNWQMPQRIFGFSRDFQLANIGTWAIMSINLANAVYLLIVLTPQPKTMLRLDLLDHPFCMNTCTFFLFSFSSGMSSGSCICCVCNSTSCQVHFIEVEMPPLSTAMPGQDVLLLVSSFLCLRKFFVFVLIPCVCWENAVRVNSRRFECAARQLVWKSTICKAQRRRLTASLFVGKCVLSSTISITFYVR